MNHEVWMDGWMDGGWEGKHFSVNGGGVPLANHSG
jgi:hypothetical protein